MDKISNELWPLIWQRLAETRESTLGLKLRVVASRNVAWRCLSVTVTFETDTVIQIDTHVLATATMTGLLA